MGQDKVEHDIDTDANGRIDHRRFGFTQCVKEIGAGLAHRCKEQGQQIARQQRRCDGHGFFIKRASAIDNGDNFLFQEKSAKNQRQNNQQKQADGSTVNLCHSLIVLFRSLFRKLRVKDCGNAGNQQVGHTAGYFGGVVQCGDTARIHGRSNDLVDQLIDFFNTVADKDRNDHPHGFADIRVFGIHKGAVFHIFSPQKRRIDQFYDRAQQRAQHCRVNPEPHCQQCHRYHEYRAQGRIAQCRQCKALVGIHNTGVGLYQQEKH